MGKGALPRAGDKTGGIGYPGPMLNNFASWIGLSIVDLITIAVIAVVVVTLVVTFALSVKPRKFKPVSARQYNAELFKRRMELEELSYPLLNEVRIGGGKSGPTKIDHVMRLPASILMIVSSPLDVVGTPRCNPNAGQWKYVKADHSVGVFLNPVVQMHPLISAIRSRFPLVRVRVLCVFPRVVEFGGRPPRGCCTPDNMTSIIREMAAEDGAPNQTMDAAWESISAALRQKSGSESNGGGSSDEEKGGKRARR